MPEYKTPIDIAPSVRPSSGNLDKSHYLRRLILDNPSITAEEAFAAFAFYDETVSRCSYNLVRAQIHGPIFTKRKTRKKRAAKVAAEVAAAAPGCLPPHTAHIYLATMAPTELKRAPIKLSPMEELSLVAGPLPRTLVRLAIGWLTQLYTTGDKASLSSISPELNALVDKLANQMNLRLSLQQKPGPG